MDEKEWDKIKEDLSELYLKLVKEFGEENAKILWQVPIKSYEIAKELLGERK